MFNKESDGRPKVTWLPEEQRDTRYYIFVPIFKCRVSNIKSMSISYLQHFGMPTASDPRLDAETSGELITRMLTIEAMAEFFNKGVTIAVCKYEDTKVIYDHISNHLNFWKRQLDTGLNTKNAPFDDLILLDKFANAVYAHAKFQFTQDTVDSILLRQMSGAMSFTKDTLFRKPPVVLTVNKTPEEEQEDKYPERASMAEGFNSRKEIIGGRPKWK
jgi:hypothetical protein